MIGSQPMPSPVPDRSAEQFGKAIIELKAVLFRSARRLTKNDTDGEDLVQDTLIRAWAARHQFEPGTNLIAWLMRIQRNLFISSKRRDRREVRLDTDVIERTLVAPANQEAQMLLNQTEDMIAALPPKQRRAFHLVVVEGCSYDLAASRLNIGVNALKSRVFRAREALQKYRDGEPVPHVEVIPSIPQPLSVSRPLHAKWKARGCGLIG